MAQQAGANRRLFVIVACLVLATVLMAFIPIMAAFFSPLWQPDVVLGALAVGWLAWVIGSVALNTSKMTGNRAILPSRWALIIFGVQLIAVVGLIVRY